jgi:hypothetical protein
MLGRYMKWSTPQSGVAFLVDIDAVVKVHHEFWRPFDQSFASTLLLLIQHASQSERIEVWGGVYHESGETHYMVLLAGNVPPSDVVSFFYGQLRQRLPEGAIIFAGSPSMLPALLPVYAVTENTVYRCAVTEDGTAPTLRVLLKSPEGPLIGQIPAVPVNLAAMLDKIPGVSLLIADLSPETGDAGLTEDGDRIKSASGEAPAPSEIQPALDEMVVSAVAISTPEEETETADSSVGAVKIVESDVVFVQEVSHPMEENLVPPPDPPSEPVILPQTPEAEPIPEPAPEVFAEPAQENNYDSTEIPTTVREVSAQGDGPSTLINIDDEDIASTKMVRGSALNTITDSELRLILTSAPLEETCQKLAAVLQKQPADIARVFALASGAPAVPGPEASLALRARTVASVVGWVLAPKN